MKQCVTGHKSGRLLSHDGIISVSGCRLHRIRAALDSNGTKDISLAAPWCAHVATVLSESDFTGPPVLGLVGAARVALVDQNTLQGPTFSSPQGVGLGSGAQQYLRKARRHTRGFAANGRAVLRVQVEPTRPTSVREYSHFETGRRTFGRRIVL